MESRIRLDMITVTQEGSLYIIRFPYNPEIIQLVKNVPGRLWNAEKKYWTIPKDRLGFLFSQLKNTPYEGDIKVYSSENLGENDTLDKTLVIPEVDISKVKTYVQKGSKLFPHQLDFLKYAIDRQNRGLYSGFLLADQMGAGKTIETMNLALYNKQKHKIKHCLIIVCVNSAKYNWVEDIKKHTNQEYTPYVLGTRLKKDGTIRLDTGSAEKLEDLKTCKMYGKKDGEKLPFFIVMNIEAIRMKRDRHYLIREQLTKLIDKGYIGMIAIDECHTNLSPQSQQGKQMLKLKKDIKAKIEWLPMTGTPIVNKPLDVFLPLKLVDGHTYNSFYAWQQEFCVFGGFGGYEVISYKNIPKLKQMLQANMIRRLKDDILDLPPKIRTIEYVENCEYQQKLYKDIVTDMALHRDEIISSLNPMAKFMRLRQVSGNPELVDTSLKIDKNYLSKNAKMTRLLELVDALLSDEECKAKVVIFSNWVQSLQTIYQFLSKKYKVCCYLGTMDSQDREKHKEAFITHSEYRIMLGTIGALGTSHTLTCASNVIFYDEPWNLATLEQAEDRLHRVGAKGTVSVYSLIAKGTVDEKVHDIIIEKGDISKFIVDDKLDLRSKPELFDLLLGNDAQGIHK